MLLGDIERERVESPVKSDGSASASPAATPPGESPLVYKPPNFAPPAPTDKKTNVKSLLESWKGKMEDQKSNPMKRPAAALGSDEEDVPMKKKPARKGAKPAAGTRAVKKNGPSKKRKAGASGAVFDHLRFDPKWQTKAGMNGPRYYGSVTIYVDIARAVWRVKRGPGRRDDIKVTWGPSDQRLQKWNDCVKIVKGLKQNKN